jgi:DNA-binding CsgD family transcriptional regulator
VVVTAGRVMNEISQVKNLALTQNFAAKTFFSIDTFARFPIMGAAFSEYSFLDSTPARIDTRLISLSYWRNNFGGNCSRKKFAGRIQLRVVEMSHPPFPLHESGAGSCNESSLSANAMSNSKSAAVPRDVLVALTYGLELLRHGALLVAEDARPQIANRAALAILQKKDGISLGRSGLIADRASDSRLLHKLLEEAITYPTEGEPKESPFIVERKVADSSLIVRVVPGPGLECWQGTEQKTALLRLYDRDLGLVVDERALVSLYGLTRGEASLAAKLVQGKSIAEAAADLFISAHTARTHLKRIFMKTDTHRQPELVVRMLLTVM